MTRKIIIDKKWIILAYYFGNRHRRSGPFYHKLKSTIFFQDGIIISYNVKIFKSNKFIEIAFKKFYQRKGLSNENFGKLGDDMILVEKPKDFSTTSESSFHLEDYEW